MEPTHVLFKHPVGETSNTIHWLDDWLYTERLEKSPAVAREVKQTVAVSAAKESNLFIIISFC